MLRENCAVLAPDGEILFRCAERKVRWLLKRNLAEIKSFNPLTVQLLFEPNGPGARGDRYLLKELPNQCVVCGTTDLMILTRHHVVPYCFRKHMHSRVRYLSSFDVLIVCETCHQEYETKAAELKQQLLKEYEVPALTAKFILDHSLIRVFQAGYALLYYRDKMPEVRREELEKVLQQYYNKEYITLEDIKTAAKVQTYFPNKDWQSPFKFLVDKISDLDGFSLRWRQHFIDHMKPKFLDADWDIHRDAGGNLYERDRPSLVTEK